MSNMRVSSFCFLFGFVFVVSGFFVSFCSLDSLLPGVFVVFDVLPFVFWFGFVFLLFVVLFERGFLRVVSCFLLVFFVWLVLECAFVNPWFSDVYLYGSSVLRFLRGEGNLAHGGESLGFYVMWGVFCLVSGFDVWFLMKWFRLLFYVFASVFVYCVFRGLDEEGFAGFSVLLFMGFYWAHQDHFCRQAFAFMLYCVGCLVSSKIFVRNNRSFRERFSWVFLLGVVLLCLFFVHPLTPVVLGLNFLVWFLFLGFGRFLFRVFLVFCFTSFAWWLMDFLGLSILGYVLRVWDVVSARGVGVLVDVFSFRFLEMFSPSYRFIFIVKVVFGFLDVFLIFCFLLFYVFQRQFRGVSSRFLVLWIVSNCLVLPLTFYGTPGAYDRFFIFVGLPLSLAVPSFFGSFRVGVGGRVFLVLLRGIMFFAVFGLLLGSLLVKFSIVSFYHPSTSEIEAYDHIICFYNDSRRIVVPDKDVPQFLFFAVKYNSSVRAAKFVWFGRVSVDQVYRYAGLIVFSPRLYAFPMFYVDASSPVGRLVEASLLVGSNRVFDAGNTYLIYLVG